MVNLGRAYGLRKTHVNRQLELLIVTHATGQHHRKGRGNNGKDDKIQN